MKVKGWFKYYFMACPLSFGTIKVSIKSESYFSQNHTDNVMVMALSFLEKYS